MAGSTPWRAYEGDVLDLLPHLPPRTCDLLLADPPYCSGGLLRTARTQRDTSRKYSRSDVSLAVAGDHRDQLQWAEWCGAWLRAAAPALVPGALVGVFCDWRQLASAYMAFGLAGALLRGVVVWHKKSGRPHPGRPRQETEFIPWGTFGARPRQGEWFRGHYTASQPTSRRDLFCQKPEALMRRLVRWAPRGGVVLDLFAGTGTTSVAAVLEGRGAVAIEADPVNYAHCLARLEALPAVGVRKRSRAL